MLFRSNTTTKSTRQKKLVIAITFIINLGILFSFKYLDFFIINLNEILSVINVTAQIKSFDLLLPVGISFYTFQALSYIMDVYRDDIKVEKNVFKYALFVSFFPQLVAGPIERSKALLPQIQQVHTFKLWNYDRIAQGCILIVWGLFQKMVIADRAAIFVNTVYDSYWRFGSVELIMANVLFALQIYCDFASYSMIAVGTAKVMGFELMENFNTPYFSRSIKEFWQRWHISLSTWFKDYLYIPLGGNRCSKPRNYFNILVTFLASGLWHGASWGFIIWGGLHAFYQVLGSITLPIRKKLFKKAKTDSFSFGLGQMLLTFILVDFAWIFFRAPSLTDAINYIYIIFTKWNPWILFNDSIYALGLSQIEWSVLIYAMVVLFLVDLLRYFKKQTLDACLEKECLWFRWFVIILLMASVFVFGIYGTGFEPSDFIYFQF